MFVLKVCLAMNQMMTLKAIFPLCLLTQFVQIKFCDSTIDILETTKNGLEKELKEAELGLDTSKLSK